MVKVDVGVWRELGCLAVVFDRVPEKNISPVGDRQKIIQYLLNIFLDVRYLLYNYRYLWPHLGCGGGIVVSTLALHFNDPSLNPSGYKLSILYQDEVKKKYKRGQG